MSVISVKALFMTASGRDIAQLTQAAGYTDPHHMVNAALTTYKICRDGQQQGQQLVRYDNARDQATPIADTALDPSCPHQGVAQFSFPAHIEEAFNQEFQTRDIAGVLSAAFYLYDRLISENTADQQIALVDNPADIRLFRPLTLRNPL